eukprot:g24453.t1
MALRLSGLRAARRLRSLHFVPGGSQKFLDKALASRADALIIDLEDSVLPAEKPAARADVARWMSSIQWGQKTVCVRINPLDTSLWEEDVELTMKAEKPDMLVVPKVSSRDELEKLGEKLTEMERKLGRELGRTTLLPIVSEVPEAPLRANEIARHPRVEAITWGAEDLSAELGAKRRRDGAGEYLEVFQLCRSLTLLAAKGAKVQAIDGVYTSLKDLDGLRAESQRSADTGFDGKLTIHPDQIDVVNAAFSPTSKEVAEAQELLEAAKAQPGAFRFKGQMVDIPHFKQAQRILDRADLAGPSAPAKEAPFLDAVNATARPRPHNTRQPPETAESVDLSRRSLSPGTRTLKKRNSRLGEGHHTKATEKSNRLWADRSEAPRPKLAEWARVQANLKPKATCAPAARRWGSDRSPSPSAASTGPSTAHSLLSPGYLDRMREKSASASWGLQLRSDTEVGRSETCVFTAPSLNVPQMRGPPSNTDSAGIKLGRLRGAQTQRPSRDSEAPESPSWWPSPGMRLASPVRSQTKSDDISPERSPALALSRAKGALGKRQLQARASGASTSDIASRLRHSEPVVRQAAVAALGALGDVEQAGQLAKLLQDSDAGVRKAAALALGNLGQSAAVYTDALLSASQHDYDDDVRFHAADAQQNFQPKLLTFVLKTLVKAPDLEAATSLVPSPLKAKLEVTEPA